MLMNAAERTMRSSKTERILTSSQVDRRKNRKTLRMIIFLSHCSLLLMIYLHIKNIPSCSAFSPLFTTSSTPSKTIATAVAKKQQFSLKKRMKKSKNKEEDHRRWMSWMSSGSLLKTRHADEVRMREAEELGGVARSERYASS